MKNTREVQPFRMLHNMVPTGKISRSILRKDGSGFTELVKVEEAGGAKRTRLKGTPDREASTRPRPQAREAVPTALSNRINNAEIETHKVEMSATTRAAFRRMMREEIGVIEEANTNKVHNSIQDIKEELKQEREARVKLEERITKLEEGKGAQKFNPTLDVADFVEKEKVVIWWFLGLGWWRSRETCQRGLGWQSRKWFANRTYKSAMQTCQQIKKIAYGTWQTWSSAEKNVIVNSKWFHVRVRNGRTFSHVVTVSADGEVLWAEDLGQMNATVKESMAEIEANMEYGQFGQHGSRQCAWSILRGPLISAMNDADHEEFVSMHIILKNLQSIRSDKRSEDLNAEIVLCNFDLMCLEECWRVDAEECFETERGDLFYLSAKAWVSLCQHHFAKRSNKWLSMPTIPVFQFCWVRAMPLSQTQVAALKCPETTISIQQ